jgi:hypothetical protein
MRRSVLVAGAIAVAVLAPSSAAFADNPPGQGPPGQSCQDLGLTTPGNAANSPGSPFNEPSGSNPGGTGGQHYSEKSQYDVACFQQSQHGG